MTNQEAKDYIESCDCGGGIRVRDIFHVIDSLSNSVSSSASTTCTEYKLSFTDLDGCSVVIEQPPRDGYLFTVRTENLEKDN